MAINFASARPGIDLFNANVARGDQERSREEQDFMRRAQMEQAQGADRGMRNAIAAYYAQKQAPAVAPVPTTTFQPTPAQAPNPAATTPVVSPDQSMDPAANPDYGGPTRAAPMPNAAPRAGVDVPATVAASPAPAAAGAPAAAQPAPGTPGAISTVMGRPGNDFAPIMAELAKQPGTGQAMMSMFSTDLQSQRAAGGEERKMQMQALKEFGDAAAKGQFQIAAAINQKFGLGMPDEMVKNPGFMSKLGGWMGAWKDKMTPEQNMAGAQAYLEGLSNNLDENTAIKAGLQAARAVKPEFQATHFDHSPSGEVMAFDKSGAVKRTGAMARQPRVGGSGGEGRATATVQNRDDMAKRLKVAYPGLDESLVQRLVVNPRAQITAQDIMRTEAGMRKLTNMGRPVYKTDAEAHTAAVAAVRAAQKDAGTMVGGEGAPAAAAPAAAPAAGPADTGPAGRVPPPVRMRFDAQGNELGAN